VTWLEATPRPSRCVPLLVSSSLPVSLLLHHLGEVAVVSFELRVQGLHVLRQLHLSLPDLAHHVQHLPQAPVGVRPPGAAGPRPRAPGRVPVGVGGHRRPRGALVVALVLGGLGHRGGAAAQAPRRAVRCVQPPRARLHGALHVGDVVGAAELVPDEVGELPRLVEEERRRQRHAGRPRRLHLVQRRVVAPGGADVAQAALFAAGLLAASLVLPVGLAVLRPPLVLLQLPLQPRDGVRRLLVLLLEDLADPAHLLLVGVVHQLQVLGDVLVASRLLHLDLLRHLEAERRDGETFRKHTAGNYCPTVLLLTFYDHCSYPVSLNKYIYSF